MIATRSPGTVPFVATGLVLMAALLAWAAAAEASGLPASAAISATLPAAAEPAAPAHKSSHAEPAGESGSLNPVSLSELKGDLAVWTAAVFLVLLLVLWKFAWRPLANGLDEREREIAGQIAQAEQANRKAQDLLAQYEQRLASAQHDVRGLLDQGRRDAEQLGREMLQKAKGEAKAEHQRALRQIDSATVAAIKELADRGATLAVELAGKILRAQLSPKDHAKLIQQTVADFVKQPPSKN